MLVIDASFLAKLSFREVLSDTARTLYRRWAEEEVVVCAPLLLFYEIVSIGNKKIFGGFATNAEAESAIEFVLTEPLDIFLTDDIHLQALHVAQRFGLRSAYDAHYLALAQELDCEFWTADERLYNAVRDRFPLIRWLGAVEALPEDQPDEDR